MGVSRLAPPLHLGIHLSQLVGATEPGVADASTHWKHLWSCLASLSPPHLSEPSEPHFGISLWEGAPGRCLKRLSLCSLLLTEGQTVVTNPSLCVCGLSLNWVRGRLSPGGKVTCWEGCWPPFICDLVPASYSGNNCHSGRGFCLVSRTGHWPRTPQGWE